MVLISLPFFLLLSIDQIFTLLELKAAWRDRRRSSLAQGEGRGAVGQYHATSQVHSKRTCAAWSNFCPSGKISFSCARAPSTVIMAAVVDALSSKSKPSGWTKLAAVLYWPDCATQECSGVYCDFHINSSRCYSYMPVVFLAWFCFTCVIDMIYPLWSGISFLYYLILSPVLNLCKRFWGS